MTAHLDILPEAQRGLLPALAPLRPLGFVLYGGTAIALHLGHRVSIDFDFFTDRIADRTALYRAVPRLGDAEVLQDEPDSLTVRLPEATENVKVSFFSRLHFGRVAKPSLANEGSLLLASPQDLLGHKLKVLLQRVESKDYADIAALLRSGLTLEDGLGAANALFANFPPCEALRALTYFEGGDLAVLKTEDRDTLRTCARDAGAPSAIPIVSGTLD